MCDVLLPCMYMCQTHAWCLWKSEEGIGSPETGVTDGWEAPCGCWEMNTGTLKEQQVLLTVEPSFQLPVWALSMTTL